MGHKNLKKQGTNVSPMDWVRFKVFMVSLPQERSWRL